MDADPHRLEVERADVRRAAGTQQASDGGAFRHETHTAMAKKL